MQVHHTLYFKASEHQDTKFCYEAKLRIEGESLFESPLHQLPEILRQLESIQLNTYAIRFEKNKWERFNVEIRCEYPTLIFSDDTHEHSIVIDLAKKMQRLIYYYTMMPELYSASLSYDRFIKKVSELKIPYCSWTDDELYHFPLRWEKLDETYDMLSPGLTDKPSKLIKRNSLERKPMMQPNQKDCRFDAEDFINEQMIIRSDSFGVVFNYEPHGESRFHLMINALSHHADLSTSTPRHLFELEALLRTVHHAAEAQYLKLDEHIVIHMQKHASVGMTMPHLHIHLLIAPRKDSFCNDLIRQFQAHFASMLKEKSIPAKRLTKEYMTFQKRQLAPMLTKELNNQLTTQYQRYTLFSPYNTLRYKQSMTPDTAYESKEKPTVRAIM